MKTATVQQVHAIRQWDGPNGTIYFHKLTMDNGDSGDLGKRERDAVKTGDSLTYTLEANERGNRIKPVVAHNGGRPMPSRGGQGSTASFALSYAKDLAVLRPSDGAGAEPLGNVQRHRERGNRGFWKFR